MPSSLSRVLLAGALALPLAPAQAITCNIVYDRNDNAIFQDTYPPIDLSARGQAERDAMYKRGEHLIVMETDRCPAIQFLTGSGGNTSLSVDEVIAGMKPALTTSAAATATAGQMKSGPSSPSAKAPPRSSSSNSAY